VVSALGHAQETRTANLEIEERAMATLQRFDRDTNGLYNIADDMYGKWPCETHGIRRCNERTIG
jgi:hypothetical protein